MRSDSPQEYNDELSNLEDVVTVVTRGPALVIATSVLTGCVVCIICIRVYTRLRIQRWFGVDDVFSILSSFATAGFNITVILGFSKYGWDRHSWTIPITLIQSSIVIGNSSKLIFSLCATLTRLSFLGFYYRLTENVVMKRFKVLLHISVVFVIALCVVAFCAILSLCRPVRAYWTFPPIAGAKCIDETPVALAMGCLHTFADLLVTVLPIPVVMKLQMSRVRRMGVLMLFGLGFSITAAGAARTYFSWFTSTGRHDLAWDSYQLFICAVTEVNLGLICCCVPTIRVFIARKVVPVLSSGLTSLHSSYRGSEPTFKGETTANFGSDDQAELRKWTSENSSA
ncbi:hypothetical protein EJ08DRAFT_491217 [Tothia fuscella]|uniref:Rhodopsin domain-containing protein n=1 Tax=Tothia fuscella TaxID=1048955 RepID=A0A9P4NHR1_9PEZI|nr:hypothetical protein EJ08DRAFT_491217 [Tothia fuscella]